MSLELWGSSVMPAPDFLTVRVARRLLLNGERPFRTCLHGAPGAGPVALGRRLDNDLAVSEFVGEEGRRIKRVAAAVTDARVDVEANTHRDQAPPEDDAAAGNRNGSASISRIPGEYASAASGSSS